MVLCGWKRKSLIESSRGTGFLQDTLLLSRRPPSWSIMAYCSIPYRNCRANPLGIPPGCRGSPSKAPRQARQQPARRSRRRPRSPAKASAKSVSLGRSERRINRYAKVNIHTYIIYIYIRVDIHVHVHIRMNIYIHIHTHTLHTRIHMYTRTKCVQCMHIL